MKFIETKYFLEQIEYLKGKWYNLAKEDYNNFKQTFYKGTEPPLFGTCYKYRWMNSSIPTGKRWWLRFIMLVKDDTCIPLMVYSKKFKQNVSRNEIESAMASVYKQM